VIAAASRDPVLVRAIYLTLEAIGWFALIPLSVASLLTGVVQSLGTTWGLLRHYWVLIKLMMNLFATGVLLLYMQTLSQLAQAAKVSPIGEMAGPESASPIVHAAGAVVLLMAALTLSVFKPRGLTGYGRRHSPRAAPVAAARTRKSASNRPPRDATPETDSAVTSLGTPNGRLQAEAHRGPRQSGANPVRTVPVVVNPASRRSRVVPQGERQAAHGTG
jgi:hypothetical protein